MLDVRPGIEAQALRQGHESISAINKLKVTHALTASEIDLHKYVSRFPL